MIAIDIKSLMESLMDFGRDCNNKDAGIGMIATETKPAALLLALSPHRSEVAGTDV